MRTISAGLTALLAAAGASAYPLDVENAARWAVLDGLPEYANGDSIPVEINKLRTRDLAVGRTEVSAVCGALGFPHDDEGEIAFIVLYSRDEDGRTVSVGRPFLYGTASGPGSDPQRRAAQAICDDDDPLVIRAAK